MNNYSRYTFKAKRKDNGEWVVGSLMVERSTSICLQEYGIPFIEDYYIYAIEDNHYTKIEVKKETICQFTGLQDIDGKDIFENDVVELQYSPVDDTNKFIIKFGSWGNDRYNIETLGFYFKDYKNYDRCFNEHPIDNLSQIKENIKIVGNKFDKEED